MARVLSLEAVAGTRFARSRICRVLRRGEWNRRASVEIGKRDSDAFGEAIANPVFTCFSTVDIARDD